jgi:hypothetical protein
MRRPVHGRRPGKTQRRRETQCRPSSRRSQTDSSLRGHLVVMVRFPNLLVPHAAKRDLLHTPSLERPGHGNSTRSAHVPCRRRLPGVFAAPSSGPGSLLTLMPGGTSAIASFPTSLEQHIEACWTREPLPESHKRLVGTTNLWRYSKRRCRGVR